MKKKYGFTLIELIVAMAILSIIIVPISQISTFSFQTSVKTSKKVDLYNFNQYIMQTFKSKGKNYIKFIYAGNSSYEGYFYFNTNDELITILDNNTFTGGTDAQMVSNGASSSKLYGAYISFETSTTIGKNSTNNDIVLTNGLDTVKIYVKVVKIGEEVSKNSDLLFYMGR